MQASRITSHYDIDIDSATSDELLRLTSEISHRSPDELQELLDETSKASCEEVLLESWKQDVEDRMNFDKDQRKNSMYYIYYVNSLMTVNF